MLFWPVLPPAAPQALWLRFPAASSKFLVLLKAFLSDPRGHYIARLKPNLP
jgi:hypothetical protein